MEVEENFRKVWGENFLCGYSMKTNSCSELVLQAKNRGWFAEVVSDHEFDYASTLGFGMGKMICNGPAKNEMLRKALEQYQILNLDHIQEVQDACNIIEQEGLVKNKLWIGLRVNFDLERFCLGETSAGKQGSRFGISYENGDLKRAIDLLNHHQIPILGLHMHTSTTTRSLSVFQELSKMACKLANEFEVEFRFIDIGGGFFGGQIVKEKPTMKEYAEVISEELKKHFDPLKVTLIVEPGASIIATAVDYVAKVVNIRDILGQRVVTLDGTVLHINPFMVNRKPLVDIVGNDCVHKHIDVQRVCGCTCIEKDVFDILLDEKELLCDNELIFHNAGAYTMSFNSYFILTPPRIYTDEM